MNDAAVFAGLLGGAMLLAVLGERARIPAAVSLVAAGMAAGALAHVRAPFPFGPALLIVFLPPIVFEAAWNVDLGALRANVLRISVLAFPGTLITAFAIAGGVTLAGALPFGPALLLGAMIAATDPVAVVAIFRRIGTVPRHVATIVEAESILNDGVAVVLFTVTLDLVSGAQPSAWRAIGAGLLSIGGGALLGIVLAAIVAAVLGLPRAAEYEVTLTMLLAYGAYLGATAFGTSGIIATAAGAVALRAYVARGRHGRRNDAEVDAVWSALAFAANATVFFATGLLIEVPRIGHEPLLVAVALIVVFATRGVLASAVMRTPADRWTVFFAGMRGALPLALALSLPASLAGRAAIIDAVFAVVLVTLVVQGARLEPMLRRLYSRSGGPSPSS